MNLADIFGNRTIGIAVLAWFVAQVIKIIINCIEYKSVNWRLLVSSGGMPSSHSSFVSSLATSIGIQEGFATNDFAICFVISMVVMYDAAGVRRAAGKQAKVLNILIEKAEDDIGIKFDTKLKELLGHSPIEVFMGAILGIALAVICTPIA